jgi:hypothetical protein
MMFCDRNKKHDGSSLEFCNCARALTGARAQMKIIIALRQSPFVFIAHLLEFVLAQRNRYLMDWNVCVNKMFLKLRSRFAVTGDASFATKNS